MEFFKTFIHDMIHMTEGEKLVNYWWFWLVLILAIYTYLVIKADD